MFVIPDELYPGCSNDQRVGEVTEVSGDTVQYVFTQLEDGTPMVSYGWYQKIDRRIK